MSDPLPNPLPTHEAPSSTSRHSSPPTPNALASSSSGTSSHTSPSLHQHDAEQTPNHSSQLNSTSKPNGTAMTAVSPSSPAGPSAYPQPKHHPNMSEKSSLQSRRLLSHHLQKHPDHTAKQAIQTMFPKANPVLRLLRRFKVKHSVISGMTKKELQRWNAEGPHLREKAGWRLKTEDQEEVKDRVVVSDLFWKMYLSLMPTLERDPLSGLVPPDLMGSTTTMPLSIISLIPDIMQHYKDVMIRAEKEIFLATNYWQPSNSVTTISGVLRDLSKLVLKEGRPKVVVKLMYDRGSFEQFYNAHAPVKEVEWAPLHLPTPDEIQGLDLEVINFHKVLLGTFHAKLLIVDRKVALLNSNNIQDRPNLELMTHFEGPVVDAFYEIAIHSWYNRLAPPLPFINKPYQPPRDSSGNIRYLFADHNPYFDDIEILKAARAARILLRRQTQDLRELHDESGIDRFRDAVRHAMEKQRHNLSEWKPGERLDARAQHAMLELREFRDRWSSGVFPGMGSRSASRSGSRMGSRRTSASDIGHKAGHFADKETAAITARNATLAAPIDPSEAPSTPTVIGDQPPKSKTMPVSPVEHVSRRLSFEDPTHHSPEDGKKAHVAFLDTSKRPNQLLDGGMVDSPIERSPILKPKSVVSSHQSPIDATSKSTAALSTNPIITTEPAALSDPTLGRMPSNEVLVDGKKPTDETGQPLPASAQMPEEMSKSEPKSTHLSPVDAVLNDEDDGIPSGRPSTEAPPEGTGSKRMFQLSKMFNAAGVLSEAWATVEDSDELDNFRPHVVHSPHDPFPIAMCCRKPHGFPGHHDIRNPQNAAWLAGMRYAQKKVFIQSPTLNARPIVRGVKQACRRGVDVTLLLDLGFNDKGESIPFQGGTNEEVVDRLYKALRKEKKEQFLKVYWYTGKDQVRPLNAVKKQRNCHIKFAAYDDQVIILGNGNQDSQSWFHSQEVNVMIDNKQICAEMMDTLLSNQNTIQYGLVGTDGKWRDGEGKTLEDYGLTEKGAFRGLSAFMRFAKGM